MTNIHYIPVSKKTFEKLDKIRKEHEQNLKNTINKPYYNWEMFIKDLYKSYTR